MPDLAHTCSLVTGSGVRCGPAHDLWILPAELSVTQMLDRPRLPHRCPARLADHLHVCGAGHGELLLSYSFYRFECAICSSVVLGVVGVGGLGQDWW